MAAPAVIGANEYTYGLFGCFGDCGICIMSWLFPCYIVGKNAEFFGEDCGTAGCLALCCGFPYELIIRNRLRTLRNIQGTMTMDILMWACCGCCALIQDAREIEECKKAGMTTGVMQLAMFSQGHTNQAMQHHMHAMPPQKHMGMARS